MKWYWILLIALAALTLGVIVGRSSSKKGANSTGKSETDTTTVKDTTIAVTKQ